MNYGQSKWRLHINSVSECSSLILLILQPLDHLKKQVWRS